MGYVAITSAEIAVGQPVQNPTFVNIKGDLDYFKTTTDSLSTALQNPEPLTFDMHGDWWLQALTAAAQAYKRVWTNISLSGGTLWVPSMGSAGTTEVDILYKRGGGAYTSIFSTKPSVVWNAGSQTSANGVLTSTPLSLLSGDFLRLDVTQAQTGSKEFHALLAYSFT